MGNRKSKNSKTRSKKESKRNQEKKNKNKKSKRNGNKGKNKSRGGGKRSNKNPDSKPNNRKFVNKNPDKTPSKENEEKIKNRLAKLGFTKMPTPSTMSGLECLWDELENLLLACPENIASTNP